MIIKILGILDILSAVFTWIFFFLHIMPSSLITVFAFYLLIKGLIFLISKDVASILDIICSVIIFLSLSVAVPSLLVILVVLFLLQKGIFSLLA